MAALVASIVLTTGGPASADPAVPTNYRSVVVSLEPEPDGVSIEIVGGDAFLSLEVAPSISVLVPGYQGEPYIRIDADGTVHTNRRSPARYVNVDRFGVSEVPEIADASASPEWEQVGGGGRFAWHDHRVHWMSRHLPPSISGDRVELVFPWSLTIEVDEQPVVVSGELYWVPDESPTVPLALGALALVPLLTTAGRTLRWSMVTIAVVGLAALAIAVVQFTATPAFDRGLPIEAVFPLIAVALAGWVLLRDRADIRGWGIGLISALALAWWAWGARGAVDLPVLPSALPEAVERIGVALAGILGASTVVLAGSRLARSRPDQTS